MKGDLQQLNLLATDKINTRHEKWLGARSWIRTQSGMHVENYLKKTLGPYQLLKTLQNQHKGLCQREQCCDCQQHVDNLVGMGESSHSSSISTVPVSPWLSV